MNHAASLSAIHQHIMWNRLISVVEEQAQTPGAYGLLDQRQGRRGTSPPACLTARAGCWRRRLPARRATSTPWRRGWGTSSPGTRWRPWNQGDVFITNDPWFTSGHLHDITVVTPTFYRDRLVGLFANTCHVVDIGGRGFGPDARQVFEEGLTIPILHLFRRGQPNDTLLELIRANVREPEQVSGDIFSFAAANDTGSHRLQSMMAEFRHRPTGRPGGVHFSSSRGRRPLSGSGASGRGPIATS